MSALQSYESGERVPRVDVVLRLAELYGVGVEAFASGEGHHDGNGTTDPLNPNPPVGQSAR